jgi:hypothetical protein
MRYFDLSGRVQVISLVDSVGVTNSTPTIISHGSDQTATAPTYTMPYVDRTGYYSYILHIVVKSGLEVGHTLSLSAKMQSATDVTSASTWTSTCADFTSLQSTAGVKDAYYKQLYLNTTGAAADYDVVGTTAFPAGWRDQCSTVANATYGCVYTAPSSAAYTKPVVFDARLMGSLRNAEVIGKYIAPWITVADTHATPNSPSTTVSASLILTGDTMPVITGGTAGTDNYYTKGQ